MSAGTPKKRWLPREGFTADVLQSFVKQTILNPTLTLPLFLLACYTERGQQLAAQHETALRRLQTCLYLGIARVLNGFLNRRVQNNWVSDTWNWKNELAVVTGGSDGIGKLLVHHFAAKNVKTIILDIQEPTYTLPNDNVHYLKVDLSSASDITSVSASLRSKFGNPTIVVLNAGIANRYQMLSLPDHLLERVFAVNTLCHFRLMREFIPAIAAANHGMIVTVASLAGFVTVPGLADYCSTKASAVAFHEGLSLELKHRYNAPKVRTVCVCPNFVSTKLSTGFENKSPFLSPTLYPETVAETVFEKIERGDSGFVCVPRTHEWLAMTIRAWPWWMQLRMRDRTSDVMLEPEKEEARKAKEAEVSMDESIIKVG